MSQLDLNFHETFAPEREHLGRLLLLADNMPFMTKEEISAETGIPTGVSSGKVIPHIKYGEYMGLVNVERRQGKLRLSKTFVGAQVASKDPYFTEPMSQLLCHYSLTSRSGAPLWRFIVREYVPTHGTTVNRADVQRSAQAHFGKKVNLTPFVSCYTHSISLGPLGLLRVEKNRQTWSFIEHSYEERFGYLYSYTLLWEWDQLSADSREVTINDVMQRFKWGAAFLWDISLVLDVLSALQDLGAVKLNRQLEPVIVIRTMDTATSLHRMYSLLG